MELSVSQVLMPVLVALLIFLFVLAYFDYGEKKDKTSFCPQCGGNLEEGWNTCSFCGLNLVTESKTGSSSIVLGFFSILFYYIPFIGLSAIVLGGYAFFKRDSKGKWGLFLGLLGLIIYVFRVLLASRPGVLFWI